MGRSLSLIMILISVCLMFSGCYDRREVEDQTYVIAMGLDKGTVEPLRLTLQFAAPQSVSSSGGGQGGSQGGTGSNISTVTLEAPALSSGFDMANGFIGKRVNLSHTVVAVFSEKLAKEGISKYMFGMARNRETRPNIYIAVSKCSAEDYLRAIQPVQEVDPSKYYELLFSAYKYTGFTPNCLFYKIYDKMTSIEWQPVAALADVTEFKSSKDFRLVGTSYKEKGRSIPYEGDFKAGEIPKVGDVAAEVMGMALFNGDKFVGEMDGEDATDRLFITGEFSQGDFTIPDPKVNDFNVILNIKQSRKPIIKVDINDSKPRVSLKIQLEADIESIQSGYNYESPDKMPILEKAAGEFLTKEVYNFLDRTAYKYECDICGFGRYAKRNFLTYDEWEKYDWPDKYKDSAFDVNIDLKIRRPSLMLHTPPIIRTNTGKDSTDTEGGSQ